MFLPFRYRTEIASDARSSQVITITTPSGALQLTNRPNTSRPPPQPAAPLQEPGQPSAGSIGIPFFDYQERQVSGDLRWTTTNVEDWDLDGLYSTHKDALWQ